MSVMLLGPNDYYSQRNNPTLPYEACGPTSRVMFYIANHIPFHMQPGVVPDEYFMRLLCSNEAKEFANQKYPDLIKAGYHPYEIHGMYGSWLDERVTGRRRTDFRMDLEWDDFERYLTVDSWAIHTSGRFPHTAGHQICVVGLDEEGRLRLADPYGNYHTNYADAYGYDVRMSRADFERIISSTGSGHWGHVPIE